jgi:hypothetical protein
MPAYSLYTRQAAEAKAIVIRTSLAASKLRLFKSTLSLNVNTTHAQLLAAEADFSGYTAGGYAIANFSLPVNNPGSGSILTSPAIDIRYIAPEEDPPVGNSIAGWWVETSAGTVRIMGVFDQPITLSADGDGFTWIYQLVEAANPNVSFSE